MAYDKVAEMVLQVMTWIADNKPFGIVYDTAPICYGGELGLLVWDYIIWNELTFVDQKTKSKQSLFNDFSDKRTREKFDELVSKYGI